MNIRRLLILNRYVKSSFDKNQLILNDKKYFCPDSVLKKLRLRKYIFYLGLIISVLILKITNTGLNPISSIIYLVIMTIYYYLLSYIIISEEVAGKLSLIVE